MHALGEEKRSGGVAQIMEALRREPGPPESPLEVFETRRSSIGFQRSEIVGLVADFGTTFAAVPDLIAMLRRRSSKGMNLTMAGIMGVFQIAWVYYGLLIESRPVVAWNMIAVVINVLSVGAYLRFARNERRQTGQ